MNQNIEHELKYTIDLPKFYAQAQPFITRGLITTRVIKQWYIPEMLRESGIVRIRQVIRGTNEVEYTELTIKVPTDNPAIRREFNFTAPLSFKIGEFIDALNLHEYCIVKDRWDIRRMLGYVNYSNQQPQPEFVVDFFGHHDGTTTGILEVENPPTDWTPPPFVLLDVTNDMSFTNFAMATQTD